MELSQKKKTIRYGTYRREIDKKENDEEDEVEWKIEISTKQ